MGVDVGDVRLLDVGGVEHQLAVAVGGVDEHAVQLEQPAHDLDVGDLGHAAQPARLLGEHDGHHRLRDEVLGAPDLDVADERVRRRRRRGWRSWAQPNTDAARRRRLDRHRRAASLRDRGYFLAAAFLAAALAGAFFAGGLLGRSLLGRRGLLGRRLRGGGLGRRLLRRCRLLGRAFAGAALAGAFFGAALAGAFLAAAFAEPLGGSLLGCEPSGAPWPEPSWPRPSPAPPSWSRLLGRCRPCSPRPWSRPSWWWRPCVPSRWWSRRPSWRRPWPGLSPRLPCDRGLDRARRPLRPQPQHPRRRGRWPAPSSTACSAS